VALECGRVLEAAKVEVYSTPALTPLWVSASLLTHQQADSEQT
jgi:hypothetical protein